MKDFNLKVVALVSKTVIMILEKRQNNKIGWRIFFLIEIC